MGTRDDTKKALQDDAKRSKMINWFKTVKVDPQKIDGLIEKYGIDYSYKLILDAMIKPYDLAKDLEITPRSSAKIINYILETDLSTKQLANALDASLVDVTKTLNTNKSEPYIPTPIPEVSINNEEKQKRLEAAVDDAYQHNNLGLRATPLPSKASVNLTVSEQFAEIKGNKKEELSFADLEKHGITPEEIAKYLSPEDIAEIHAGKTSRDLLKSTKRQADAMDGSGYCLSALQRAALDSIPDYRGYPRTDRIRGESSNSACFCHQAWEKCDFAVFQMKNDYTNGNPCLKEVCAGGIVNFEGGPNTKHGHVCVSGDNGYYYCDVVQSEATIASGRRGSDRSRYGENFYISYPKDCTLSDELVQKILRQRELDRLGVKEEELPEIAIEPIVPDITRETTDSLKRVNGVILTDTAHLKYVSEKYRAER